MKRLLIAISFLLVFRGVAAQSQYAQPADGDSLPGVYQLADFPEANQPKFLKTNPWPASCQFFGIY